MTTGLSGVRADRGRSYRDLENAARRVRKYLKLAPDQAINALQLFENLDQISLKMADGKIIPLRERIVSLEDTEGYTRYDE